MKLAVFSDLHLERAAFAPPLSDADVVVLAGDIGVGTVGVRWAAETFPEVPVVYVPGNHEFDGSDLAAVDAALRTAGSANVHVLNNDAVTIDGVRFLGCTLWTDYALFGRHFRSAAMEDAAQHWPDHQRISVVLGRKRRRFMPHDALSHHEASRRWLAQQLATPQDGPTVVVTHHAPHRGSLAPRYARDPLSAAVVSDLDALMSGADLWIHGHTHASYDYNVDGTRVLCNPRGYPLADGSFENDRFDPALIVRVDASAASSTGKPG